MFYCIDVAMSQGSAALTVKLNHDSCVSATIPRSQVRTVYTATVACLSQELSYRQQIARQLRTEYAEGIYRHKYYTVTLKSR